MVQLVGEGGVIFLVRSGRGRVHHIGLDLGESSRSADVHSGLGNVDLNFWLSPSLVAEASYH